MPEDTTTRIGFSPRRLAHVNLYVGDLDRSLAFYRDVCGLTPVFAEPGIQAVFLSNGNSHHDIALMQSSDEELLGRDGKVQVTKARGSQPGLNHIAFEIDCEADLVRSIRWARRTGVAIKRTLDHQISRSAYLSDPDGIVIECYADSTVAWRDAYRNLADELITSQWEPDLDSASTEPYYERSPAHEPYPGAAFPTVRTSRAALRVSDLDRSVAYYTSVVGLCVLRQVPEERTAVLAGQLGNADLLLIDAPGEPPGLHHSGFLVPSVGDLEAGIRRLRAAGVEIVNEIARPDLTAVVARDPDGNLVELYATGDLLSDDHVLSGTDREFTI